MELYNELVVNGMGLEIIPLGSGMQNEACLCELNVQCRPLCSHFVQPSYQYTVVSEKLRIISALSLKVCEFWYLPTIGSSYIYIREYPAI
jgi:hypothetical protein